MLHPTLYWKHYFTTVFRQLHGRISWSTFHKKPWKFIRKAILKVPLLPLLLLRKKTKTWKNGLYGDETKRSLSDSPGLRKELLDGGLRQNITNIDSSSYEERKELFYKAICDNGNFRIFIHQLLVIASVLKKSENWLSVLDIPPTKIDQRQHPAILHNKALINDDEEECSDTALVKFFARGRQWWRE